MGRVQRDRLHAVGRSLLLAAHRIRYMVALTTVGRRVMSQCGSCCLCQGYRT